MRADDSDDDRIAAQLRAHGSRVEASRVILWSVDVPSDRAREFADRLSDGVREIEQVLGTPFNARHFRQAKIECFVSPDAGMSHAYSGRKPWFFVTTERVNARQVPYRHELTHIVAWWSCGKALWLQEGFADYVADETRKRFPHDPEYDMNVFNPRNRDIDVVAKHITARPAAARVLPLIGADAMPMSLWHRRAFNAIFADREITAPAFYNLSHSFTRYVVKRIGLPNVEAACRAWKPSRAMAKDAGIPIERLKSDWLAALR